MERIIGKLEKDVERLDGILHELRTNRLRMDDKTVKKDLNIVIQRVVDIRLVLAKKLQNIVYAKYVK